MITYITYKFKLDPNQEQRKALFDSSSARRYVWNWGIEQCEAFYKETGRFLDYVNLGKRLTALKSQDDHVWLRKASSQSLQQALMDLSSAYKRFFRRTAGHPKFKSKKNAQSFRLPQNVKFSDGKVQLAKIGWIKVFGYFDIIGEKVKIATITRDSCGDWFVSLAAEKAMPDEYYLIDSSAITRSVGVDLGQKSLITLSTGHKFEGENFHKKMEPRLTRLHRNLSRKRFKSKRRAKARLRLAKCYRKLNRQKQDYIHKATSFIADRNDCICIEDLDLNALAIIKPREEVKQAPWGTIRRQLEYKSVNRFGCVSIVGKFFPSSKMCYKCETVYKSLTLEERVWTCSHCGSTHDRDINAAKNIHREGLKILNRRACGSK